MRLRERSWALATAMIAMLALSPLLNTWFPYYSMLMYDKHDCEIINSTKAKTETKKKCHISGPE